MGCASSISKDYHRQKKRERSQKAKQHRAAALETFANRYCSDDLVDDDRVQLLVHFLDAAPCPVVLWADDGLIVYANAAALTLSHHDTHSLRRGNRLAKLLHFDPPLEEEGPIGYAEIAHQDIGGVTALTPSGDTVPILLHTTELELLVENAPSLWCGFLRPVEARSPPVPGIPKLALSGTESPPPGKTPDHVELTVPKTMCENAERENTCATQQTTGTLGKDQSELIAADNTSLNGVPPVPISHQSGSAPSMQSSARSMPSDPKDIDNNSGCGSPSSPSSPTGRRSPRRDNSPRVHNASSKSLQRQATNSTSPRKKAIRRSLQPAPLATVSKDGFNRDESQQSLPSLHPVQSLPLNKLSSAGIDGPHSGHRSPASPSLGHDYLSLSQRRGSALKSPKSPRGVGGMERRGSMYSASGRSDSIAPGLGERRALHLGDMSLVITKDLTVASASRAFCAFVGREDQELRGVAVDSLLAPEEDECISDLLTETALNSIAILDIDRRRFRFACVDDTAPKGFEVTGETLQLEGAISHADLTVLRVAPPPARKKGVAFSRNNKGLPEDVCLVCDSLRHAAFVCSLAGTIEHWNDGAVTLFGLKNEEVVGMNVDILVPHPWGSHHQSYMDGFRDEPEFPERWRFTSMERGLIARGMNGEEEVLGGQDHRRPCLIPVRASITELVLGKERTVYLVQARRLHTEGLDGDPVPPLPAGATAAVQSNWDRMRAMREEEDKVEDKIRETIHALREQAVADHTSHPFVLGPPQVAKKKRYAASPSRHDISPR